MNGTLRRRPVIQCIVFAAIYSARVWPVRGRMVMEDPEVFYLTARLHGIASIDDVWAGYQHLIPRGISLLATAFPTTWAGYTMQALAVGGVTLGASVVAKVVGNLTDSALCSWLGGVAIVGCPILAESSLGNVALLHFPLVAVLAVIVLARPRGTLVMMQLLVVAMIGLSDPLPLVLLAAAGVALGRRTLVLLDRRIFVTLALTTVVQVGSLLTNTTGRPSRNPMVPWGGMSRLWWGSILLPLAMVVLAWWRSCSMHEAPRHRILATRYLAGSAIAVALSAWALGGLADRYLVAPSMLASIALLTSLAPWRPHRPSRWVGTTVLGLYAVLAIGAFAPRQFLRDGLAWREAVAAARTECAATGAAAVRIDTVGGAIDAAPCSLFDD